MPIEFNCSGCAKRLRVADQHVGKKTRCPDCKSICVCPAESQPLPEQAVGHVEQAPASVDSVSAPAAAVAPAPAQPKIDSWRMRTADGEVYGPSTYAELSGWAQQGRVPPDAEICRDGETEWVKAIVHFPALREMFSPQASHAVRAEAPTSVASMYTPAPRPRASSHVGGPNSRYRSPHRGGLILSLSIISLVFCAPLALAAIIMAFIDLQEMSAGRMDPSGRSLTVVGLVVSLFALGVVGFGLLAAILS